MKVRQLTTMLNSIRKTRANSEDNNFTPEDDHVVLKRMIVVMMMSKHCRSDMVTFYARIILLCTLDVKQEITSLPNRTFFLSR